MARLKFYENEANMFKEIGFFPREVRTDKEHALLICRKLSRHFKFNCPEIKFYGKLDSGYAKLRTNSIRLNNNPSYIVIIHELAHIYNYQKNNNGGHHKKLMRTIKRFAKYVMKKNYWIVTLRDDD